MLYAAGILLRLLLAHPGDFLQEGRKQHVAAIDFLGHLLAFVRQEEEARLPHRHIAVLDENAHGPAHARFGDIEQAGDIHRAGRTVLLLKTENRLKVIFPGFMYISHLLLLE